MFDDAKQAAPCRFVGVSEKLPAQIKYVIKAHEHESEQKEPINHKKVSSIFFLLLLLEMHVLFIFMAAGM